MAAEAVGAQRCVRVEKFPDGLYNKALLLTMNDGREVGAKVPNPNAGRAHFITASEVAIMKSVRRKLKTPLPKVYTWCSRLEDNPIGAEYIIMEKASGVQLESIWPKLGSKDRFAVVKTLGNYQKAWTSIRFHGFGSIYFTDNVPSGMASALAYTDSSGIERTDPETRVV
ncbi:hypothetical protein B9Z65_8149 [Elsinoe australis]|uniref:Altered inheritance of mitochondria protein 9, mitochondrial n=1 Tax=Elsinoe australis TaxID=40998 RepID=A0A2P7YW74_9PEZI|nr:hypothetical protein B9Z65_8149 [Elsinoe australis]